jgi:hypothetical protein
MLYFIQRKEQHGAISLSPLLPLVFHQVKSFKFQR